jgi:excisionase family DNA binding protein
MDTRLAEQLLSTTQVASALGISVSTVKRWVEEGILPAQKTAGGHRKLVLANVLEVARRERLPTTDLSRLVAGGRRKKQQGASVDGLRQSLYEAMLAGKGDEVRQIILGAYQGGLAVESLADQVISPAMQLVGHDWEMSRIDVMHEHRGTQLCAAALFELKALVERRASVKMPLAVGGAPSGDYSVLPTLLAQIVLIDAGWETFNLGANTPLNSLTRAVVEMRPRLMWLSVSHLGDRTAFIDDYRTLYAAAELHGTAVIIGGRSLEAEFREAIPYTSFGDGLTHLSAFARTLHQPPRRRQRGRPREKK